jgi:hypothetical protein
MTGLVERMRYHLLSCSSGGIPHDEKIKTRRSSNEVVAGSNDNVVVPFGWRNRTFEDQYKMHKIKGWEWSEVLDSQRYLA